MRRKSRRWKIYEGNVEREKLCEEKDEKGTQVG